MFYEPGSDHGLVFDPFKSCVVPRPIGWISTISPEGISNLAPYSQFQNLTFDPPYVMFAANQNTLGKRKDTTVNAEQIGEFVYNMATFSLREAVNRSARETDPGIDEFDLAGVTKAPSKLVKPFRVAESPVQMECRYHQTLRLPGTGTMGTVDIIIGRVVAVHIQDEYITKDGKIDILKIRPIGRLGYYDYAVIDNLFEMVIPGSNPDLCSGMEGAARKCTRT
jgi:flavin reductase (DIM6/NTAB) family NADH-FMN oxidoreductase RutF